MHSLAASRQHFNGFIKAFTLSPFLSPRKPKYHKSQRCSFCRPDADNKFYFIFCFWKINVLEVFWNVTQLLYFQYFYLFSFFPQLETF